LGQAHKSAAGRLAWLLFCPDRGGLIAPGMIAPVILHSIAEIGGAPTRPQDPDISLFIFMKSDISALFTRNVRKNDKIFD
jgi:hypothetical protein